jgi:hypothetical protein
MGIKKALDVVYNRGEIRRYEFEKLSDLRGRNDLDLTGVKQAYISVPWPSDSMVTNHPSTYIEVQDAKKLLKKIGFVFTASKSNPVLREEKPKPASETLSPEQTPAEPQEPAKPRENGIYLEDYNASVVYDGQQIRLPILRKSKLYSLYRGHPRVYGLNGSELALAVKLQSHRLNEISIPVMRSLDTVLETAKDAEADLIAFTPSPRGNRVSEIGMYNCFRIVDKKLKEELAEYNLADLRKRLGK